MQRTLPRQEVQQDMNARRRFRDRAAKNPQEMAALWAEPLRNLAERVQDFQRDFPSCLLYGGAPNIMPDLFMKIEKIRQVTRADLSSRLLEAERTWPFVAKVQAAPDALPFPDESFDLMVMAGGLHWVTDLEGCLCSLARLLRPDGALLACLPGAETLGTFGHSLIVAELALKGGASPRISPMIGMGRLAGVMQGSGFALPVVDRTSYRFVYREPMGLVHDLRALGEQNAVVARASSPPHRLLFPRAFAQWQKNAPYVPESSTGGDVDAIGSEHGSLAEGSQAVEAWVDLLFLQGVKPPATDTQVFPDPQPG